MAKKSKTKDIWLGKHYLMSTGNSTLYRFVQDCKNEAKRITPHKRGIILGYCKVNLSSLKKEGLITETERKVGTRTFDRIRQLL